MSDSLLLDLDLAVKEFKGREVAGKLGYEVSSGVYAVVAPNDPSSYLVRSDRSRFTAYNLAKVPPIPDLEVVLKYDPKYGIYIDRAENSASNQKKITAAGGGIGIHNHSRYSGNAFLIDTRLFMQLSVYAKDDDPLVCIVREGRFDFHGRVFWFPKTEFNLAGELPPVGKQQWGVFCIDPTQEPPEVVLKKGVLFDLGPDLTFDLITQIDFDRLIPLTAVKLRHGASRFEESDFESLYPIATGWKYDEFAEAVNRILVDSSSNILIDASGNVVIGDW